MAAFHTERKVEGNNVTITQGEGDERIVRRIERNFLPGGKWEMIESYRKINEETPVSCVRTVQKSTDGGWLTISRTEGYNTPWPKRHSTRITTSSGYLWKSSPTEATRATSTTTRDASFCKQRRGQAEGRKEHVPPTPTCASMISGRQRKREVIIAEDGTETVLRTKSLHV